MGRLLLWYQIRRELEGGRRELPGGFLLAGFVHFTEDADQLGLGQENPTGEPHDLEFTTDDPLAKSSLGERHREPLGCFCDGEKFSGVGHGNHLLAVTVIFFNCD